MARQLIALAVVALVAWLLANVAFGRETVAGLLSQTLPAYFATEGGKRMLGFLALILFCYGAAVWFGGLVMGWACRVVGVTLLAVAGFGWWNHQLWWLYALGIGYGGIILLSTGSTLIGGARMTAMMNQH